MLKIIALSAIAFTPMLTQAAKYNSQGTEKTFIQIAKNCVDVDLTTWKHPTRAALIEHEFEIQKVQLCNGGKYQCTELKPCAYL